MSAKFRTHRRAAKPATMLLGAALAIGVGCAPSPASTLQMWSSDLGTVGWLDTNANVNGGVVF